MRIDIACDVFHLFGEQGAAIDLGEAQRAAGEMNVRSEAMQCAALFGTLGEGLE